MNVLDKQWAFNGVPKLRLMYRALRFESFEASDYDEYQKIVLAFESALEERAKINQRQLLAAMGLGKQEFNDDLESQYPREIYD